MDGGHAVDSSAYLEPYRVVANVIGFYQRLWLVDGLGMTCTWRKRRQSMRKLGHQGERRLWFGSTTAAALALDAVVFGPRKLCL